MALLRLIFCRLLRGKLAVFHTTVKVASMPRVQNLRRLARRLRVMGGHFNDTDAWSISLAECSFLEFFARSIFGILRSFYNNENVISCSCNN